MSNITPHQPTRTVTIPVQRVEFDLVPVGVLKKLFHAAFGFVLFSEEEELQFESEDAKGQFELLQAVVSEAGRYCVEEMREVQEPI